MLLLLFYNTWYTNQVITETHDPTTTMQLMNYLTGLVWIYHDSTTSLQYNWCTGSTELNIQGKSHWEVLKNLSRILCNKKTYYTENHTRCWEEWALLSKQFLLARHHKDMAFSCRLHELDVQALHSSVIGHGMHTQPIDVYTRAHTQRRLWRLSPRHALRSFTCMSAPQKMPA